LSHVAAYRRQAALWRYWKVLRVMYAVRGLRRRTGDIVCWPPFDLTVHGDDHQAFLGRLRHYLAGLDVEVRYFARGASSRLSEYVLRSPDFAPEEIGLTGPRQAREKAHRTRFRAEWSCGGRAHGVSLQPSRYVVAEGPQCHGATEWMRLVNDLYVARSTLPSPGFAEAAIRRESLAVLGTGPSVDLFVAEAGRYSAWIGANYVACDPAIRTAGRPFAVCAIDPYCFAPLDANLSLWDGVFRLVRQSDAFFVTTLAHAAFVELHFPADVRRRCRYLRVIGQPPSGAGGGKPGGELVARPYGNVLTDLMLPLAGWMSRSIVLYGCDGAPPGRLANFPKSTRYQRYDDDQVRGLGETFTTEFFRGYHERNGLYTRYVVDALAGKGVAVRLRSPSWNRGLAHLPVGVL
jgi:hypothetical protein